MTVQLYQYLQQLPLSGGKKESIDLPPPAKAEAFNIVWDAFLNGDFQQRWEVAKYLPKFGESAIAPLTHLLHNEVADLDLRCEAAAILGQINASPAIFTLTKILNTDSDPEVIAACTNALVQKGKTAIPILTEALANPETRLPAVEALAYLREPEITTPLMTVVDDPQPEIRSRVIEALSSFRDSQLIPLFINALQDTHAQVRQEAVIACGVRGKDADPEAVILALKPLLYDININICSHCAIALGKIGTATAITALAECLHSSVTPVSLKQQIIRSLSYQENEQTLAILAHRLKEESISLQAQIMNVLGRWKRESFKTEIAETLVQFYAETVEVQNNPTLKQSLALALGNLGVTTGKKLLSQLTQDETEIVKLHATAALKKLP
ncbi:MAG: HEAT repeat domain-containing protein [Cyanobacteria bacterium]|jgi:HEAT repeat protein|nr:HEAT repeat domain-containing protein [Cyanobacteria bacterium GSL.Bin21]